MANVKISDLTAAAAALGTQQFEVNESGTSKRVTGAQLDTYIRGNVTLADISSITATAAEINILDGATVTTAELNVLDGITSTTAELNYTDGVTSNIQTQLNSKVAASGGTLINPSVVGTIDEDVYAWGTTTGAVTIEPDLGSIQLTFLTGNVTASDGFSSGEAITLMINDGSGFNITWPTMTWVNNGGAAPTLATTGFTVVALWKITTTLYGALVGDGS
jgi:hypothetical protein